MELYLLLGLCDCAKNYIKAINLYDTKFDEEGIALYTE